jgi:WD40-like Beta Propeller Repeat
MSRIPAIACSLCLAAAVSCFASTHASAGTASIAPITLDGIIHPDSDDTLAFTPDDDTVFFDRSNGPHKTIMVSHKVNGHWSKPQIAGFSGHWFDQDPVVSPDGSYLLFNSDRPTTPGGKPLTQDYFAGGNAPGSNIWKVERKGDAWGTPVWLGPIINDDPFVDFASIATDGTLYFIRWDKKTRAMHIWRSLYRNESYLPAVRVGLGDPDVSTHDPAIAPDQSFIVFDYGKTKGGLGRLCIAFRQGDHWSRPIDLGDVVNKDLPWGAHVSTDGDTVYVTGQSGIWRLSLAWWLKQPPSDTAKQ